MQEECSLLPTLSEMLQQRSDISSSDIIRLSPGVLISVEL